MTSYSKNLLLCDAVIQSLFFTRATKSIKLSQLCTPRQVEFHWVFFLTCPRQQTGAVHSLTAEGIVEN